jgi:hypothetical protein
VLKNALSVGYLLHVFINAGRVQRGFAPIVDIRAIIAMPVDALNINRRKELRNVAYVILISATSDSAQDVMTYVILISATSDSAQDVMTP